MAAYCVTPTGELIIYNGAAHAVRTAAGKTELYADEKQTTWVADIPATWAVGWTRPTLSHNAGTLKDIKRALSNYNAKTGRWRNG